MGNRNLQLGVSSGGRSTRCSASVDSKGAKGPPACVWIAGVDQTLASNLALFIAGRCGGPAARVLKGSPNFHVPAHSSFCAEVAWEDHEEQDSRILKLVCLAGSLQVYRDWQQHAPCAGLIFVHSVALETALRDGGEEQEKRRRENFMLHVEEYLPWLLGEDSSTPSADMLQQPEPPNLPVLVFNPDCVQIRIVHLDSTDTPQGPVSRTATEKAFPSGCVYVRDFHPFVYMKTELSEAELQDDLLSLLHEQLALFKWKSKVQHLRAGAAAVGGGGKQASNSSLPVGSVVSGRRDALWLKKRPDLESIYGYIDREEELELSSGTRRDDKNKKQVVYQIFTKYIIYMKILIDSLGPFSHLFELFEAHIPYNLHFLEQTRVVGMGWLKVPSALVAARIGSRKATTCDVEVEIAWKQLMQHGTNDVTDSEDILQKHWLVKALKGLWIEEGMRCEKNGLDAPEPGSPILRECGDARQNPRHGLRYIEYKDEPPEKLKWILVKESLLRPRSTSSVLTASCSPIRTAPSLCNDNHVRASGADRPLDTSSLVNIDASILPSQMEDPFDDNFGGFGDHDNSGEDEHDDGARGFLQFLRQETAGLHSGRGSVAKNVAPEDGLFEEESEGSHLSEHEVVHDDDVIELEEIGEMQPEVEEEDDAEQQEHDLLGFDEQDVEMVDAAGGRDGDRGHDKRDDRVRQTEDHDDVEEGDRDMIDANMLDSEDDETVSLTSSSGEDVPRRRAGGAEQEENQDQENQRQELQVERERTDEVERERTDEIGGPVVIGERQLEVRRQEPDHNIVNSSSLLIEDANPEEAAQEELLLKKRKAEKTTTEGVGAVDSMGRLKGAIKKAPDKVFENLKFTEFGCVLIVEAVCFGNELAMVAWRTLGGDAEAGCICNRRSVSLDLVPRAAAAFPRRAGEDHIHQVVQDGDRTDNPPTSFPYQPCAGVLEVPITSTNGTTSPSRAGGGGRVTGGDIPTVLQMAENQSAVFNAVELLVKRLEPNLLLSYDVPEGLGLILHHGRRENMQQRLSRVPGEEPRGFGFAPTAEQGKAGGGSAFLAGGTKAGVGFGGVPLYNQHPLLGIKAANAFTTSEHFPARVGSSAMAYRASGASGRLDNSALLSQNSDENNQDVLVSRPDFDPGNHTSSSSSDHAHHFGAHNAGGPQQHQNEDADSDDEKQYRAKYPAEKLTGGVSLKGRLTFSLWRVLRKQAKLPNTELNTACEQLVGETFPSFDTATLKTLCRNPGTALFAALYLVKKCTASFNILLSMNLLTKCAEVARLLGVDFFSVLSRGSQFRVESILSRAAHSDRYLLFTPTKDQVRYQRAHECTPLVLEPKSDFYYDPVLVVDFQSLYPSIMIAYNMCFSTCVGRVEVAEKLLKEAFDFRKMENSCKNPSTTKEHPNWIARLVEAVLRAETVEQEGDEQSGARSELRDEVRHLLQKRKLGCLSEYAPSGFLEDSLACPNGAIFVQHFKGVVTKMIHEILQTRIMLKKSLKLHRKANKASADLERLLEARIFGLKMVANVTYGYIGAAFSGRMPCSDIADAIVYTARRTLEDTMRLIEREFPHCEVVYGDTDSVFVRVKRCHNLQHAFRVGQAIVRKTTERHPWPMELELEKVYWPCCLVSKKRYVGYSYSSPTQEVPSFDAKGIETVRRDSCRWTQQEMKNVLEIMFSGVREHLMRENDAGASSGGAAAAGGVVEEHLSSHQAVDDAAAPRRVVHTYQSIDQEDESTPLAWRRRKLKLLQRNVRRARLYFLAQAKRIRENRVPKTDLLFYKETRRLEDYAVLPVHAYIVDKGKLVPNKRVPYGIGTGPGRLLDKARAPQNFGEPDAEYYLHKHLVPALQRCFALIGEDVKSWLPLKPRTYFLCRNQASSSTSGTLARFLKRTCAFCNATLPLANYEVVDVEWKGAQEGGGRDPSLTDIEDGYCAPCVGAGPAQLGQLCTTFDCEKLGQKMLALARTEGTALHDVV
eukprot:g9686.t1